MPLMLPDLLPAIHLYKLLPLFFAAPKHTHVKKFVTRKLCRPPKPSLERRRTNSIPQTAPLTPRSFITRFIILRHPLAQSFEPQCHPSSKAIQATSIFISSEIRWKTQNRIKRRSHWPGPPLRGRMGFQACRTDDVSLMAQALSLAAKGETRDTVQDVLQACLRSSLQNKAVKV